MVRLEVEEANARAIAFYEAYGFTHAGRTARMSATRNPAFRRW